MKTIIKPTLGTLVLGMISLLVFQNCSKVGNAQVFTETKDTLMNPTPPAANKAPMAVNDAVAITAKTSVTIPILANDSDPEGKSLQIIAVGRPGAGGVHLNADNTVAYTPASKFKTSDTFSYTISDGSLSSSATVTVILSGSNGKGDINK